MTDDEAEFFRETWPAFQKDDINVRALDTDMLRIGWPKPTIYREHETIHVLANLVDQLRKRLENQRENIEYYQNLLTEHETVCPGSGDALMEMLAAAEQAEEAPRD